jgi:hypothetical protein
VGGYLNGYDPAVEGLQLAERYAWLPDLGLAWSVTFKPKLFYFLLLAMDGGQIAVFAVQDMLLFFLAWELELIPVYLLLAIWGGKRQYAATKFILYTAGSPLLSWNSAQNGRQRCAARQRPVAAGGPRAVRTAVDGARGGRGFVLIGLLGTPWHSRFAQLLDPDEAAEMAERFSWSEFLPLAGASVAISVAGISLGQVVAARFPAVNAFFANKWYLDALEQALRAALGLAGV